MAGSQGLRLIELRHLTDLADLTEAVRLQKTIWGYDDVELLPLRLFVIATRVGGQVIGAYDDAKMVGFLLSIPGLKPGSTIYLHSHMMGVLPDYRNVGVGRMLKLEQRNEALARGVALIEWTFDPLELKNAYFNMERLGAVVRRYVVNHYGTTTSHLHGGLPTDRCVAEWYIDSERVRTIVGGEATARREILERVAVPGDIDVLRANHPKRAREIQAGISQRFAEYFDRGLAVVGFERSRETGTYLLGPWNLR